MNTLVRYLLPRSPLVKKERSSEQEGIQLQDVTRAIELSRLEGFAGTGLPFDQHSTAIQPEGYHNLGSATLSHSPSASSLSWQLADPESTSSEGAVKTAASSCEPDETEASFCLEYVRSSLHSYCRLSSASSSLGPSQQLAALCEDGILLCHLLNHLSPGAMDERAVNTPNADSNLPPTGQGAAQLGQQDRFENLQLCCSTALAMGCELSQATVQQLAAGQESAFYAFILEVLRASLLQGVTCQDFPELSPKDSAADVSSSSSSSLVACPPGLLLEKWLQHHVPVLQPQMPETAASTATSTPVHSLPGSPRVWSFDGSHTSGSAAAVPQHCSGQLVKPQHDVLQAPATSDSLCAREGAGHQHVVLAAAEQPVAACEKQLVAADAVAKVVALLSPAHEEQPDNEGGAASGDMAAIADVRPAAPSCELLPAPSPLSQRAEAMSKLQPLLRRTSLPSSPDPDPHQTAAGHPAAGTSQRTQAMSSLQRKSASSGGAAADQQQAVAQPFSPAGSSQRAQAMSQLQPLLCSSSSEPAKHASHAAAAREPGAGACPVPRTLSQRAQAMSQLQPLLCISRSTAIDEQPATSTPAGARAAGHESAELAVQPQEPLSLDVWEHLLASLPATAAGTASKPVVDHAVIGSSKSSSSSVHEGYQLESPSRAAQDTAFDRLRWAAVVRQLQKLGCSCPLRAEYLTHPALRTIMLAYVWKAQHAAAHPATADQLTIFHTSAQQEDTTAQLGSGAAASISAVTNPQFHNGTQQHSASRPMHSIDIGASTNVPGKGSGDVSMESAIHADEAADASAHVAVASQARSSRTVSQLMLWSGEEEVIAENQEERVLRLWLNSLSPRVCVNSLWDPAMATGWPLLQALEGFEPGCVNWPRTFTPPFKEKVSKIMSVQNCNMVIRICTQTLHLPLVNIGGLDLAQGQRRATLSLVWQMMRLHVSRLLGVVGTQARERAQVEDTVLRWANSKLVGVSLPAPAAKDTGGPSEPLQMRADAAQSHARLDSSLDSSVQLSGLSDPRLAQGLVLLELLAAISPRAVDRHYVLPGATEAERESNAKYVVSVARKLGCVLFLGWEDIVAGRPNLMLVLLASLMALDMRVQGTAQAK